MIHKIGKHRIELYDSTQNLPILRFQKLNKYVMVSAEVGNTFEDYDARTQKALEFLKKEMIPEAMQELNNRRQTVFNAYNEFTPVGKAFACLIKRIDEVTYIGQSPDELDQILEHLERIGLGYIDSLEMLNQAKKKIETELQVYFPGYFPKVANKQHAALRIKRMKLMLDAVINEDLDGYQDRIYDVEKQILQQEKPSSWNVYDADNMERVMEVDFGKFAISVQELTGIEIQDTSTFTFYAAVEHLKERNKKAKKHG